MVRDKQVHFQLPSGNFHVNQEPTQYQILNQVINVSFRLVLKHWLKTAFEKLFRVHLVKMSGKMPSGKNRASFVTGRDNVPDAYEGSYVSDGDYSVSNHVQKKFIPDLFEDENIPDYGGVDLSSADTGISSTSTPCGGRSTTESVRKSYGPKIGRDDSGLIPIVVIPEKVQNTVSTAVTPVCIPTPATIIRNTPKKQKTRKAKGITTYLCHVCNKEFGTKIMLEIHARRCWANQRIPTTANTCTKKLLSKSSTNKRTYNPEHDPYRRKSICNLCNKELGSTQWLVIHQKTVPLWHVTEIFL